MALTPQEEFLQALQDNGFMINEVIMDGAIHRAPVLTDRRGELSGSYCGYLDGRPAGWFQNFKVHLKPETWKYSARQRRPGRVGESRKIRAEKMRKDAEARKRSREAEIERKQAYSAELCRKLFKLLPNAENNGYLRSKGIVAYPGMKQDKKGNLVVPVMNAESFKIQSLQRITPTGFKKLKKNARKHAGIYIIGGKLRDGAVILLAEGVSTAASITMALKMPVVVCFDAGNLPVVAALLKKRYPASNFIICGDDDRKGELNKGVIKAEEAAQLVEGRAVFPEFASGEGFSDWNDLHVSQGLDEIATQIRSRVGELL